MGFGFSGNPNRVTMVGADAIVTWVDTSTGTPNAVDYFLTERSPV